MIESQLALDACFSFPRSHRLLTSEQFQAVFDRPAWRVTDRHFLILARNNELTHPRLGVIVGRRRARRAVDRTAIKRRAREQFRLRQHKLMATDLIVLLRSNFAATPDIALTPQLARLLDKLLAKRWQA